MYFIIFELLSMSQRSTLSAYSKHNNWLQLRRLSKPSFEMISFVGFAVFYRYFPQTFEVQQLLLQITANFEGIPTSTHSERNFEFLLPTIKFVK